MFKQENLSNYIDELISEILIEIEDEDIDESTTSGDAAGYDTPNAFGDNSEKSKSKTRKVATQAGYTVIDNDVRNISESDISYINKNRAKSSIKQKLKGKRDDGMGKWTAKIVAVKDGERYELKTYNDLAKYSDGYKYGLVGEDKIPGGLAQGMTLHDIANKHKVDIDDLVSEFRKGIKVEMEHTTDVNIAKEITLDHLFEDPKYYTKLATIETESINFKKIPTKANLGRPTGKELKLKVGDRINYISGKGKVIFVGRSGGDLYYNIKLDNGEIIKQLLAAQPGSLRKESIDEKFATEKNVVKVLRDKHARAREINKAVGLIKNRIKAIEKQPGHREIVDEKYRLQGLLKNLESHMNRGTFKLDKRYESKSENKSIEESDKKRGSEEFWTAFYKQSDTKNGTKNPDKFKWNGKFHKNFDTSTNEATDRDYSAEYQARKGTYYKKYQASDKAKKYRAELNQYNRKKGTYGNGDGLDASHKGGKIVGFEKESINRSRKEKSRLKKESLDTKVANLLSENRWLAMKNDESMHSHKKLAVGLRELRNQLHEVEKFLGWYNKLKNINELDSENYWKRTKTNIYKIKERIINIVNTLKEIEK